VGRIACPALLITADPEQSAILAGMDLETKIGQLFCPVAPTDDLGAVSKTLEVLNPGGLMFRAFPHYARGKEC